MITTVPNDASRNSGLLAVEKVQNKDPLPNIGLSIFNIREISNPKPLNQRIIRLLSENPNRFFAESVSDNFDMYSLSMLLNLAQPDDQLRLIKQDLERIFNDYFTPLQLNRHLNNMLILAFIWECRDFFGVIRNQSIDIEKLIKNQLSLIRTDRLMEAAAWAEGKHDDYFMQHLVKFLELEGKNKIIISESKKSKGSILPNGIRNFLISDHMLSEETPTSLFEANAVYGAQMAKVNTGATLTFGSAFAIGPLSLLFLNVPLLISLASKLYFNYLDAPPSLYPLLDCREIDLTKNVNFLGRDEIIKEIITTWQTNKYPLLVGNPGVGKTTIIEQLAQLIASGIVPGFENKVLFMGSAAQVMAPNQMGPPHLERIVKAIQPYKDNTILVLDEFHALTQDKASAIYVRTMLDGSQGSIRYGLFATTTEDYEKHIQPDESLRRRLRVIDVKALGRDCLLHLLHREVKLASLYMDASPEAIEAIYEHTRGNQNESRQSLYKIVRQAEASNRDRPCYTRRQELQDEIQKNESLAISPYYDISYQNQLIDNISALKVKFKLIEEECEFFDFARKKHEWLLQSCHYAVHKRSDVCQIVNNRFATFVDIEGTLDNKVQALSNPEFITPIQEIFKRMLFLRYFDHPNLVRFLDDYARLFKFTHVISRDFVLKFLSDIPKIEHINA